MKARIYFNIEGFPGDNIIVSGETCTEILSKTLAEMKKRGAVYSHSEILEDETT